MILRSELQKCQRSIVLSSLSEDVKHIEEYTKKRKKEKYILKMVYQSSEFELQVKFI